MRNRSVLGCKGLTLIELIVVLLVISILSAVVALRFDSRKQIAALSKADLLRSGIAHAQYLALNMAEPLSLAASASGYSVCLSSVSSCNAGTAITDPATGNPFSETFSADGVTMTMSGATGTLNGARLDFDSIGRPSSGSSLILTNPVATYTLEGAGRRANVTVSPVTGFAQVSY